MNLTTGRTIPVTWYCLLVPPQKERATREHLRAAGIFAFYPSREKRWTVSGKTFRRELPEITRYVFAQFRHEPAWHILKERRRLITGVMGGSHPYPIPTDIIKHLQGLTVEAQKLEAAKKELMRLREGDKAKVIDGPFKGFVVDIRGIHGDEAEVDLPLTGKVKASLSVLEKVLP
jgi:transcription antitermination factor NusG